MGWMIVLLSLMGGLYRSTLLRGKEASLRDKARLRIGGRRGARRAQAESARLVPGGSTPGGAADAEAGGSPPGSTGWRVGAATGPVDDWWRGRAEARSATTAVQGRTRAPQLTAATTTAALVEVAVDGFHGGWRGT